MKKTLKEERQELQVYKYLRMAIEDYRTSKRGTEDELQAWHKVLDILIEIEKIE